MRKTYRIKNKFRFMVFVAVMVLIISVLMGMIVPVRAHAGNIRYIEVKVCGGDTLWGLAGQYGPENADIRQLVYEISRINGVTASTLRPGMDISIPTSL